MARRAAPLGAIAVIASFPAIALASLWRYADANVPPPTTTTTTTLPPPPQAPLDTSLLSFRRHPTPLSERVAAAEEAEAIAEHVERATAAIPGGSCLRVQQSGETIAAVASDVGLIPASNQKLLVAAVALEVLGPEHRFTTSLWGPPVVDGAIPGNLYLVGGGDPVLWTADVADPLRYPSFNTTAVEPLADQLLALGVANVEGDLIGDGSRYDDEFRAPTWGDNITNRDAGPYDALLINDGLLFDGNYGLNPNQSAARRFLDLVRARGISVSGSTANAARPADGLVELAAIESLPLADVLVELLHTSDNNTAEMLVKEIGFVGSGLGTRQAGLDLIRATLEGWQVPTAGLLLHDGSGLSRENRASCDTLAGLLSTPVADDLRPLLPVAGESGTLVEQLLDTSADGVLAAKTGTLTDVKALTGSQPSGDRSIVDFSVVLNMPGADEPEVHVPIWTAVIEMIDGLPITVEREPERFAPPQGAGE